MSLVLRNADLEKSIPLIDLLDIIDRHEEYLSDRSALLESNDWVDVETGYRPATPDEIMGNLSDAVYELRQSILAAISL